MRKYRQTYVTAHLSAAEIALISDLATVTGKTRSAIASEAIRAYLEPYKAAQAKAIEAYNKTYTTALTQQDIHK